MKKILYIIRHGQTDFNKNGIVQGSGVDSNLNETGVMQSLRFFSEYKNIPFDAIYTSALKRTIQSAQPFIDLGIRHHILPELNEICWGEFEGKEIDDERHTEYLNVINKWRQGDLEAKWLNAESPLEMQARQHLALEKIMANTQEKTVLVATHGRYLRGFLCLLTGHPLHLMDDFEHGNLCLYILEYKDNKFEILKTNCQNHLS